MSNRETNIKNALAKYLERQEPKHDKPRRKHGKPEKDTEKDVCKWLIDNGFDYSVIEAKAVYNRFAGRYIRGQVESGFSDIHACNKWGHSCYIELKAKGRRSTVRTDQWSFLHRKISMSCFAVVVDSAEYLEDIYRTWEKLITSDGREAARRYLYDLLPTKKEKKNEW